MLQSGVNPPGWGGSSSLDDNFLLINIPFSISMYGYSTTTPSIQSNGVNSILAVHQTVKLVQILDIHLTLQTNSTVDYK